MGDLVAAASQQECPSPVMEVVLKAIDIGLILLGVLAFFTRVGTSHYVPFQRSHASFLTLVLTSLVLRLCALIEGPCLMMSKQGEGMLNFLASAPTMTMFTIFSFLFYDTMKVLRSIRLTYVTALQDEGRRYRMSSCRCLPFWVILCGRTFSPLKLLLIALNILVWILFVLALATEKMNQGTFTIMTISCIQIPSVVIALLMGVGFLYFGLIVIDDLHRLSTQPADVDQTATATVAEQEGIATLRSTTLYTPRPTTPRRSAPLPVPQNSVSEGGPTCLERRITPPEGTDSSRSSWLRASWFRPSWPKLKVDAFVVDWSSMRTTLPPPSSADAGEVDDGSLVILGAPQVELVVRGLKLVLFVMFFCVLSFLLRAIAICVYIADGSKFQGSLWLPYLLFVELLPECICLVFYLLPGVEALCRGSGLMCCQRVVISSRVSSSVEASVTGSC